MGRGLAQAWPGRASRYGGGFLPRPRRPTGSASASPAPGGPPPASARDRAPQSRRSAPPRARCFRRPRSPAPVRGEPIRAHVSRPRPTPSSARAPPSACRPARQSVRQAVGPSGWLLLGSPERRPPSSLPASGGGGCSGGGAVPREARRGPSGGRGASSPARRLRRPGGQHGGGGGGGRGPRDGPRAGVRRGAALHQPLLHRRGRLRHGVVSVRAPQLGRPRLGLADAAAVSPGPRPGPGPRPPTTAPTWAAPSSASWGPRAGSGRRAWALLLAGPEGRRLGPGPRDRQRGAPAPSVRTARPRIPSDARRGVCAQLRNNHMIFLPSPAFSANGFR